LEIHTTLRIADLAVSVREDTSSFICSGRVVVARFAVLTSDNFVTVTNTVAICVLEVHTTLRIADFAVFIREDTGSSIRRSRVVIAGVAVLTSDDFVVVTNTVAIRVLEIHATLCIADLTVSTGINTS
jgi:hypothetical protein